MLRPSGLEANMKRDEQRIIAIGGSAGAIGAIKTLCDGLRLEIPAAICIVIHVRSRHAYTAEALASEQEGSVDEAMRVALRIVEERAVLTEKMAEEARRGGLRHSAASFERTSAQSREHVGTLRGPLRKSQEERRAADG
jgi:CheB methylesterase